MKTIKEHTHGLLLNYFGLDGKYYLAVSMLTFFGFDHPDEPLKEQEMWPFVQGELGNETIFDQAMPKPKAEVLLRAKCFAPGGHPVPACPVSFRAGNVAKRLAVFGPRNWRSRGGLVKTISDPELFSVMDISWANAFGGLISPATQWVRAWFGSLTPRAGKSFPCPRWKTRKASLVRPTTVQCRPASARMT